MEAPTLHREHDHQGDGQADGQRTRDGDDDSVHVITVARADSFGEGITPGIRGQRGAARLSVR